MTFVIDPGLLGLEDVVAYVTGAGQGIGQGCALQLAAAGCHVAVLERDGDRGRATAASIERVGRRALFIETDALDPDSMQDAVASVRTRLGAPEVACHVVGNPAHAPKPLLDITLDEWNRTVHQNLGSAFIGTRVAALAMIEAHLPGRIINVSSSSGVVGAPNVADYGAAKAGVIHLTTSAAMELARYGIRVNCIVPGTHERTGTKVDAPASPAMAQFRALAAKAPPLGRLGDSYETGGLAVFLASRLSSYMTGHAVFSDGGVVHTTARPPVGMDMVPEAIAHLDWVQERRAEI